MSIKLRSSDGIIFEASLKVAKCSETIKTMLEDLGIDESVNEVVPLPTVSSRTLSKILEWADHHKDDTLLKITKDIDELSPWDFEFIKIDQATLFDIILAANFLDIKNLLDIGCTAVANIMKGKSPEELRKTFNVKNDFTPEEMEQVRRENEWSRQQGS